MWAAFCAYVIRPLTPQLPFLYEAKMADYNREHSGRETLLLVCSEHLSECSSTLVRDALKNGADLSELIPESISDAVKAAFEKNDDN